MDQQVVQPDRRDVVAQRLERQPWLRAASCSSSSVMPSTTVSATLLPRLGEGADPQQGAAGPGASRHPAGRTPDVQLAFAQVTRGFHVLRRPIGYSFQIHACSA